LHRLRQCLQQYVPKPGGGVFALKGLLLDRSTISGNQAVSAHGQARGGGIYVEGDLLAKYSTVSNNAALGSASNGGGIAAAFGNATIYGTTVAQNTAGDAAGIALLGGDLTNQAYIYNSTISSNAATDFVGGIKTSVPLTLTNSTVVFNSAPDGIGGLYADHRVIPDTGVILNASIIAGNAGNGGADDFDLTALGTITGSHNLIVASSVPLPPDTIRTCPHVEPLADNGGPTLTHGLRHDSPAIDQGSNTLGLQVDQRMAPRVTGNQPDIGAVEHQPSDSEDGLLTSGFDGLCIIDLDRK
jgi:hypothetical protein